MNDLITVIMTAYNHERYIQEAIESILNQSYENWELIIVDDGSTDNTKKIIETFNDSRIKKIYKSNGGTSDATNIGIDEAKGDWVALMSGDDISHKDRIKTELEVAKKQGFDVVFSIPELIDDRGKTLSDEYMPVFYKKYNSSKGDVLKELFYNGNIFCAPSAMINKKVFEKCGKFKRHLLQLQDFDLWIRIAKKFDIKVIRSRLVKYRIHKNNLSSKRNDKRLEFEMRDVYKKFFDKMEWDDFFDIFLAKGNDGFAFGANSFDVATIFILINNPIISAHTAGLEKLANLIEDDKMYINLIQNYGFTMKKYFEATALNGTNNIFVQ
ncbi:glycosyltransferase family 2 protein [Selenomonas ruminantium]|uniref:glycosyltransferase family 2 protein n=1 Tax=Selenomonas ruminantium TaxID=971 RepID=UPI00047AE75D|nr:glycosyltransferase [Selenomonas ruminantium]